MTFISPFIVAPGCRLPPFCDDLDRAHRDLLHAIENLEQLTEGPLPTRGVVVEARWNISSASLTRRTLWHRILAHFSSHKFDDVRADIRGLQDCDMRLLHRSSVHVATWSIDAVMADWDAYCVASKHMRDCMKDAIEKERAVLSVLLGGRP